MVTKLSVVSSGLEWESVKSKYEDIRKDFVTLYEQQDGLPYNHSLLTRERIASKIKDIRQKYRKAVDSGRSGGGRIVATFCDACNEILVACPATTSLEPGVDTADFEVLDITAGKTHANPRSVNSPSAAHVPDLNIPVGEESSEVELISCPETPYSTYSEATDQKGQSDATDSKQVSTNRKKLIGHIKEKPYSKLTKSKSADQPHLAVIKEELSLKKEMVSEMKQVDKEFQQTIARFTSAMENLSHSVSSAFAMMGTLLQRSQPTYWQPQMPQYMAQQ